MQVSFKVRRSSTKHDRYLHTRCLGIQIPMLDQRWVHAASVAEAVMTSHGEAACLITIGQINILQLHIPNGQPDNEQSRTRLRTGVRTNRNNHARTAHCKKAALRRCFTTMYNRGNSPVLDSYLNCLYPVSPTKYRESHALEVPIDVLVFSE